MASARASALLLLCTAAHTHDAQASVGGTNASLGFPKLFEMEDYESCARADGFYCVGDFELSRAGQGGAGDQLLQRLKDYSADPLNFNRTLLHRGGCVLGAAGAAAARARFERGVARWAARELQLHASPLQQPHCSTGAAPPDYWDWVAAVAAAVILAANVIGTVYDLMRDQSKEGSALALAWSLRSNWRRLTASHPDDTPLGALKPLQGVKVIGLCIVITAHVMFLHHQGFINNPEFIEKMNHEPLMVVVFNGTSIVQVFVMISSFLFSYSLLLLRSTHPELRPGVGTFFKCLVYRWARIAPLYLCILCFGATWWRLAGSGPLWAPMVAAEVAACRRKMAPHALFLHNVWRPHDQCLQYTWYLAAEMQLVWPVSALALLLAARPARAPRLLLQLLAASVAFNAALAYRYQYKSILFYANSESVRRLFRGEESFVGLYMSAVGGLPCALLGMLLAFRLHRRRGALSETCLRRCELGGLALLSAVILSGHWARQLQEPALLALHSALERPAYCGAAALAAAPAVLRGRGLLAHPALQLLGRLALPIYLVHWLVAVAYVALPPVPVHSTGLSLWSAVTGTATLSALLALPLHLLLEAPAQRALQALLVPSAGTAGAAGARVGAGGSGSRGGKAD